MENRLNLNKRIIYELPDEVDIKIGQYKRGCFEPNFEPDLCLVMWGRNLGEECKKETHLKALWIKTDNKELMDFIRGYNFRKLRNNAPNYELAINDLKKIILEEFYGVKHGE